MTLELSSTSTRPLSPLCEKCRSLFVQPDKPLKERIDVVHEEASYPSPSEDCHLCLILQKQGWTGPPHLTLSCGDDIGSLKSRGLYHGVEYESEITRFYPVARDFHESAVELRYVDHEREQTVFEVNHTISSNNTRDAACFEQIRRWLEICTQEHRLCRRGHTSDRHAILPTRLIDVRENPKVVLTTSHDFENSMTSYATLTHRWVQGSTAKLLRSNLSQLTQMIDPSLLSPVFQDSISIARRLGLQYIWIDALCIIQDDPEDWNRESSKMGLVYQNAFINLGASGAATKRRQQSDSEVSDMEGSFVSQRMFNTREPREFAMLHVNILRVGHTQRYYGILLQRDRVSEELIRRGWILQERLLSPRSVYFDKLLIWECPELLTSERFPAGPQPPGNMPVALGYQIPIRLETLLERSKSKYALYGNGVRIGEAYRTWLQLVTEYKKCSLTYESDIFPALSGLAKTFKELLHDEYVAGIWRGDMIRGLLWRSYHRHRYGLSIEPLQEYQAPSWSWASAAAAREVIGFLHERILPDDVNEIFLAKVHDVQVTMASPDPMGQVKDGYIRISGHLCSRQDAGPRILDNSYTEYEMYDYAHEENGYCPDESTLYFTLTLLLKTPNDVDGGSSSARARGLIVEPTNRAPDEYRRIGMFNLDPDVRPAFKGLDLENIQGQVITIV